VLLNIAYNIAKTVYGTCANIAPGKLLKSHCMILSDFGPESPGNSAEISV